jgi:outer membrane lipoprotein carrier protein
MTRETDIAMTLRFLSPAITRLTLALAMSLSPGLQAEPFETLRTYLEGLDSLSADFRQITLIPEAGGGEQAFESEGRLYLRRPGRFRWEYDAPSEQLIIADGERVYLHDIELNQVSHRAQQAALEGTPAQLLVSDQPLEHYFALHPLERDDGRAWVELQPKAEDSQVVRLQIAFLDGQLDTLLMEDRFGQLTRFSFSHIERNPALDDALFHFERPIGGDFLQMD